MAEEVPIILDLDALQEVVPPTTEGPLGTTIAVRFEEAEARRIGEAAARAGVGRVEWVKMAALDAAKGEG